MSAFGVAVSFGGEQVLVSMRGTFGKASTSDLASILDAVIARGHRDVVLGLSETVSLDAARLAAIVGALSHPGPSDVGLTMHLPAASPAISPVPAAGGRPAGLDSKEANGFDVAISLDGEEATVAVRGEVDLLTAPELGALLAAVISRGHLFVVLDLADTGFMDATGLHVISSAAGRLESSGGTLALRSPSPQLRRLIGIVGLAQLLFTESLTTADPHRLPGHRARSLSAAAPGSIEAVSPVASVTAIPADQDVLNGALRLVVALARAAVARADGVSVSLTQHGQLATVAASDQTITEMDAYQYATGEGPIMDTSLSGDGCHIESVAAAARWPTFTSRARLLGVNAVLCSPLGARGRTVGSLNIYSLDEGPFSQNEQALVEVLAHEASTLLREAGVDTSNEQLARRFAEALAARAAIAQAQGVLMEREGLTEEGAYGSLRQLSRDAIIPLRKSAEDVVASTRRSARATELSGTHETAGPFMSLLDQGRREAGLSLGELFLRYFELGGLSTVADVAAYCNGQLRPSLHDHEILAQALNERFVELADSHVSAAGGDDEHRPVR